MSRRRLDELWARRRRVLSALATRLRQRVARMREEAASQFRASGSVLETKLLLFRRRPATVAGLALLFGLALSAGLYLVLDVLPRLPDPRAMSSLERMPESTVVYDALDRPVFTFFSERRLRVPIERMSHYLLDAVLAIEDRRFYRHPGIDLVRVVGAATANVSAGRIVEGGSTITQQLARQSLLSTERTVGRKIAEILTALWIEHEYDKKEIFELYLNRIYFGAGFYGAEAAARGYFGKRASELSVSEAALLAGLIRAPEGYSPVSFPQSAIARRNVVLDAMLETKAIDRATHRRARREPLSLEQGLQEADAYGEYFKEAIRQQLVDTFGSEAVYERGLRVYSTIDPEMQRAAERALEEGLREIEARGTFHHPRRNASESRPRPTGGPEYLQGALIALDPVSGEVRALVGGRDFADSPFNRATQAERQPGSAFKPILYAAAVETGVTPATILDDLDRPVRSEEGPWLPSEGHEDVSALTVRSALSSSSNRAAVQLLRMTGIDRTVDYAARFGLGPQPRVPSIALGSGSVTLQSLTAAYAAFAHDGILPRPTYIRRVTDIEGEILFDNGASGSPVRRAVRPATAFIVANLLRGVLDAGTGWTVRREGFRAPAAGKTGTTDDYKDAWFIGFTPELAAGVWIGFDEPQTIVPRGYGADLAAPVWAKFMTASTGERRSGPWIEPPPGVVAVEICATSLRVATEACRRSVDETSGGSKRAPTYMEYFASGTEPVERCPVHQRSLLARLLGPFRHEELARPEPEPPQPETAPPEPPPSVGTDGQTVLPSIAVVHDHLFGHCNGWLVAGPDELRYVTPHEDAFAVPFSALARVQVDLEMRAVRVSVRHGRHYNFRAASPDVGALLALDAALHRPE